MHVLTWGLTFAGLMLLAVITASAEAPTLSLPIACEPGKTCFIQSYVDVDPGPAAQDFACGTATYDGHKGTDFRVLSAAAVERQVPVLASAEGVVKGVRDGMADAFVTPATAASVTGRECGNGVVVDHGDGWETQYCHMMNGSLAVKTGDTVARGQRLGSVGYSGFAEFAHVHLEVRHTDSVIDPFSGRPQSAACETSIGPGLWDAAAAKFFPYVNGEILGVGFTSDPKLTETLEKNETLPVPDRSSPALIFYVRAANLRAGDRLRFKVEGPGGFRVENLTEPLERSKATYRGYAGKKLSAEAWTAGMYSGSVAIVRDGSDISERSATLELK